MTITYKIVEKNGRTVGCLKASGSKAPTASEIGVASFVHDNIRAIAKASCIGYEVVSEPSKSKETMKKIHNGEIGRITKDQVRRLLGFDLRDVKVSVSKNRRIRSKK